MTKESETLSVHKVFKWIDRPISDKSEDILGRAKFADDLAKAIGDWKNKDSLILALNGNWGTGKTSIKNMVVEALAVQANKPSVLEFNPWQVSGFDQLAESFFDEIGIVLGINDKKLLQTWNAYRARFFLTKSILELFSSGLKWLLTGSAAILFLSAHSQAHPAIKIGTNIFAGALFLTGLFEWFTARVSEYLAMRNKKSLSDVKDSLAEKLLKANKPVLIVVDDIDRLPESQIPLLFQLIKANADFPNIVYLLLFQKDIIATALSKQYSQGSEFLKKIVQIEFAVPNPDTAQVHATLFNGLDSLINQGAVEKSFSQKRWGAIFASGLKPYFSNLRDVKRYLSSLAFTVESFKNENSFEVNIVDLIALETLRLFEPEVFSFLPQVKDTLLATGLGRNKEISKRNIETLLTKAINKEAVRDTLKELFPRAEFEEWGTSSADEEWTRTARICCPNFFDRYFRTTISPSEVTMKEITDFLSTIDDTQLTIGKLKDIQARGRIELFFEHLDSYKTTIPFEKIEPFITALFDYADDLPETHAFFGVGSSTYAWRIVYWCLMQVKDVTQRETILKNALNTTKGLTLPVTTIALEDSRHSKGEPQEKRVISEASFQEFTQLGLSLINKHRKDLLKISGLAGILYRWQEWAKNDEVTTWLKDQLANRDNFFALLKALVHTTLSQSSGDYMTRKKLTIPYKYLVDFKVESEMSQALKRYSTPNPSPEHLGLLEMLKTSFARKDKASFFSDDSDPAEL